MTSQHSGDEKYDKYAEAYGLPADSEWQPSSSMAPNARTDANPDDDIPPHAAPPYVAASGMSSHTGQRYDPSLLHPTDRRGDDSSFIDSIANLSIGTPANSSLATTAAGTGELVGSHVESKSSKRASGLWSGSGGASTRPSGRHRVVEDNLMFKQPTKIRKKNNPYNLPLNVFGRYSGKWNFSMPGDWVKDYRCQARDKPMFYFAAKKNIMAMMETCTKCEYSLHLPIPSFRCPEFYRVHKENDREGRRLLGYQVYNWGKPITTGDWDAFIDSANPFVTGKHTLSDAHQKLLDEKPYDEKYKPPPKDMFDDEESELDPKEKIYKANQKLWLKQQEILDPLNLVHTPATHDVGEDE